MRWMVICRPRPASPATSVKWRLAPSSSSDRTVSAGVTCASYDEYRTVEARLRSRRRRSEHRERVQATGGAASPRRRRPEQGGPRAQYLASSSAMTWYIASLDGAARRRWRKSASRNSRERRASAFRWTPVELAGATSMNTRLVGLPSIDSNSIPSTARPSAPTRCPTESSLPCGIAIPSPIAVEASISRSSSTCRRAAASTPGTTLDMRSDNSASTPSLVVAPRRATMQSGWRKSMTRMAPGDARSARRFAPGRRPVLGSLDEAVVAVAPTVENGGGARPGVGEDQVLVAEQVHLHSCVLDRHGSGGYALIFNDFEAAGDSGRFRRRRLPARLDLLGEDDQFAHRPGRTAVRLVVANLLFPFAHLPLDAGGSEVDRGVHVLGRLLGVDGDAVRERDAQIGNVVKPSLHREDGVRRDWPLLEVFLDLVQSLGRVLPHGLRTVHMPKRRRQLHVALLSATRVLPHFPVGCKELSASRWLENLAPFRAGQDAKLLAVLRHGSAGDFDVLILEQLDDALVRMRVFRAF